MAPEKGDIAIIGLACRLPGGIHSTSDLWSMLEKKKDGFGPVPESRWTDSFYHPNPSKRGAFNAKGAHFLEEDISLFDAQFFNITANEAEAMDPQHRLILECSYEALENGGLTIENIAGSKTGVFMGASYPDYAIHLLRDAETCPMYHGTGTAEALLSNRVSFFFDLHGPSMTIETACSSSLSSLHIACQSLQSGDCTQAIVGGCHLNIVPDTFVSLAKSQLLSPEGRSYAFDARALSGYGRGEGAVAIVIKPLSLAIKDNDPIRAIIKGTSMNSDGRTARGITYPSSESQERLIRSVYEKAGLDPLDTQYVEAHGTGTAVGDPVETSAIASVFSKGRTSSNILHLGSLKSQAGHLEGSCGIASCIKTAIMLEKKMFAPQGNFEKLNPNLPFDEWHFTVATDMKPWRAAGGKPLRASVNNFGFGGTNAHAILEGAPAKAHTNGSMTSSKHGTSGLTNGTHVLANHTNGVFNGTNGQANGSNGVTNGHHTPPETEQSAEVDSYLFILSAKDETTIGRQAECMIQYLEDHASDISLSDLAYTLNERRSPFAWRSSFVASNGQDLIRALRQAPKATRSVNEPRLCLVFTGQGAQWAGMSRDLDAYPVYKAAMQDADSQLKAFGAVWSLHDELHSTTSRLNEAVVAQPACTAIQISLVLLLRSWGVKPLAVIGHSSGEIAAAFAVGAISFRDAMMLAYQRGVFSTKLSEQNPELEGSMLALGSSQKEAEVMVQEIEDDLSNGEEAVVACVNSPSSVTISGDKAVISKLSANAQVKGIFNRRLRVNVAYHSRHMELVAEQYLAAIKDIELSGSKTARFFSSLAGHEIDASLLDENYWVDNLIAPVQFSQALEVLLSELMGDISQDQGHLVMVEVGPHAALEGPAKQSFKALDKHPVYMPTILRNKDGVTCLQQTAGLLYCQKAPINLSKVNATPVSPNVLTDLPPYPWKHTEKYWYESRISANHRLRKFQRHDLLGNLTSHGSELEPSWRNVLDVEQVPWLRDHKVQENVVFPLSGYLAMAVEAARQKAFMRKFEIKDDSQYVLRDVVASRALVLPDDKDVELFTTFKPVSESVKIHSDVWDDFKIASWKKDRGWTEHCRGQITVQGPQTGATWTKKQVVEPQADHEKPIDWEKFVLQLGKSGIEYGPSFRGVSEVRCGERSASSTVKVPDTKKAMPNEYESNYIMHPGVLDAACQATFPAFTSGVYLERPFVPTFIGKLTLQQKAQHERDILETQWHTAESGTICGQGIVTNAVGQVVMEMEDLTLVPITKDEDKPRYDDLCASVSYKPSIDHLSKAQFISLLAKDQISEEEKLKFDIFEKAAFFYIQRALAVLKPNEVSSFQSHHQKMYKWLQWSQGAANSNILPMQTPDWLGMSESEKDDFLNEVRDMRPAGELLCRIGETLPAICRQELDPLSIMFENELLSRWYASNASLHCGYLRNQRFVDLLGHQNPYLNIIEIGGGTAGTTVPTLEALGGYDGKMARFVKYTFTDISAGFFENAKRKLQRWEGLVNYAKLDIEVDPLEQGFTGEYDLVIAANVLHATSDMDRTLRNVRKLLKPGGKLALLEVIKSQLQHLIFATLPGWWLQEGPGREKGPCMDEDEWQERLLRAGFGGMDCSLQDFPGEPELNGSMMYATAVEPSTDSTEVVVLCDSPPPSVSLDALVDRLRLTSHPTISSLAEADVRGKKVIMLEELNRKFLRNLAVEDFKWVQRLFSAADGALWVVQDSELDTQNPDTSLAIGLARTVRSETGMKVVTLDLESDAPTNAAETIADVYDKVFVQKTSLHGEMEYVQRDGMIQLPRLQLVPDLNRELDHEMFGDKVKVQPLKQQGRPLKLGVRQPGQLDSLTWVDEKLEMGDSDVEIETTDVGLNFKDTLIALNQVPFEPFGGELSGIIKTVGRHVKNLRPGDRVCSAPSGAFATHKICPAEMVRKIPDAISNADAASIPIAFVTAYYCLADVARVSEGESILIHAAAGGVGQATIQVAQLFGAKVYATVGSAEKRDHIVQRYGLDAKDIFYSRDSSFEDDVKRVTGGKGVDVVFNSLSGELLHASWRVLAPYGRFVEIGKRDVLNNARLSMQGFEKNCSFTAVDLGFIRAERPHIFNRTFNRVLDLVHEGKLQPLAVTVYSFTDLEGAFRTMLSGKHMGKMVLEVQQADRVKALLPKVGMTGLRKDASYLLSGGTGGLGRSLSKWLARHGATNIILASRRGLKNEKAAAVVEEVAKLGARLEVVQCDVSNADEVNGLVTKCATYMPPICGVIHGAMVLQDMLFEKSDFDQWSSICQPKIPGAWNLHNATLQNEIDFFIMLGSASGIIGNRGQAAYAATCSFLNSFAQYRARLGLAATCIDIGLVEDVGYAAEQWQLKAWLETLYSEYVKERELHAVIQASINKRIAPGTTVVIGMRVRPDDPEFFWSTDPKFNHLRRGVYNPVGEASNTAGVSVPQLLKQAKSASELANTAATCLMERLSSVLMVPLEEMTPKKSVSSYGLDSLVAVEVRNWISKEMGAKIPLLTLMSSPSIEALAVQIAGETTLVEKSIAQELKKGDAGS